MNILLFEDCELDGADLLLGPGRRLEHLNSVLRSKPGDTLRVGAIGGNCGRAVVAEITPERALLQVESLKDAPPRALNVTVVLALPRPKMLRRILRGIAELGVKELHLINAARVEKSFWQSPLLAQDQLHAYLLAGIEQASDTRLPQVHLHPRFRPFAEDLLPALCADRAALLAEPRASQPFPATPATPGLLAIGPEGGFTDAEVKQINRLFDIFALHAERHIEAMVARNVVGAYLGAVENFRAHPHQDPVAERRAVHQRPVAYGDVVAYV